MTARPVLAATDGSPQSLAAVRWAADEAVRRGTALRLVHVWPRPVGIYLDQLQQEGAELLAHVAEEAGGRHPELDVETALLGAAPLEGLLDAAADGALLVLGSRGLGGFKGLLVGSVSLAVAGRSPVPVVVLRPESAVVEDRLPDRTGDVLVGVGAGAHADEVLEFTFSRARERGARVVAVHGWDVPTVWAPPGTMVTPIDPAALASAARETLDQALDPWQAKYPQVPVLARTEVGGAAKALVDASDGVDLVVIGRRIRKHATGAHLGPTAHAVLHHAHAPVAVVPHH
ncbi:universal stress protein [Streptacidiphilus melanogenes]|uniref:universal stress protein n=1 Tax=Streptacidiphilus melanogenes TaxID=411235 RepID=UPI0005AB6953|nr:universal stress protein [Streptacidiphilus melanogenes]